MTTIRLRPEELDLVTRMIDKRDSAHLSGHTTDPFQALALNGGASMIVFPGRTGRQEVPSITMARLKSLGLFQVYGQNKNVTTFDLADDIRDQLERLRDESGRPSLLAQERNARARAEGRQSELETALERGARRRQAQRQAFSGRVGRVAKWLAAGGLIALYAAATLLVAILTTPVVVIAVAIGLLLLITTLDWAFRLDAYRAVGWLEAKVAARAERWAEQFDPKDET